MGVLDRARGGRNLEPKDVQLRVRIAHLSRERQAPNAELALVLFSTSCGRSVLHGSMLQEEQHTPKHSMYAIYAYIGVVLVVNVGIYGSPMDLDTPPLRPIAPIPSLGQLGEEG